jgi:SAM-dependent methyltransferase
VRASGLRLPLADASLDLAYSSNVLEHVPDPEAMVREMLRVTKPGGTVLISWTPWLSPWGGHETAPWHYLGGRYAADRYAARHGHRPKNDFGRSLFACSIGRISRWVRTAEAAGDLHVVAMLPRYHPSWARWLVRVPGLREVVSWNAVLVLVRQ